jgi:Dodecin
MPDHVYRIIQVAGSSEKSIEDAIQTAELCYQFGKQRSQCQRPQRSHHLTRCPPQPRPWATSRMAGAAPSSAGLAFAVASGAAYNNTEGIHRRRRDQGVVADPQPDLVA